MKITEKTYCNSKEAVIAFAEGFKRDFTPDSEFIPPVKEIKSIEEMDLNPVSDLEKLAEEMEAREK